MSSNLCEKFYLKGLVNREVINIGWWKIKIVTEKNEIMREKLCYLQVTLSFLYKMNSNFWYYLSFLTFFVRVLCWHSIESEYLKSPWFNFDYCMSSNFTCSLIASFRLGHASSLYEIYYFYHFLLHIILLG